MKLVSFLMNLPHETRDKVTVELKNGTSVKGLILNCTPTMNISLENISLMVPNHDPELLPYMNIRGNQIRHIILPDDLNIAHVLELAGSNRGGKPGRGKPGPPSFSSRGGRGRGGGRGGSRGGRGGFARGGSRGRGGRGGAGGPGGGRSGMTGGRGITGSNLQPLANKRY